MRGYSLAENKLLELSIARPEDIDVEAICCAFGIKVHFEPMGKEDALLFSSEDDGVDFLINSNAPTVRQRFSIGHELGHFFLHKNKNLICPSHNVYSNAFFESNTNPEKEADQFAADLLIPPFMLKSLLKPMEKITFQTIKELAAKFQTSISATAIQIAKVNTHPIIIAVYGQNKFLHYSNKSNLLSEKLRPIKMLSNGVYAFDVTKNKPTNEGIVPAVNWFNNIDDDVDADVYEESHYWHEQILSIITVEDDQLLSD